MLPSLERPLPPTIATSATLFLHRPDLGQVAPEALRVHAAAEHEAVGNAQADEIGRDRLLQLEGLLDQHRAVELLCAELEQSAADLAHGLAVVEDVVDHQHHAPLG